MKDQKTTHRLNRKDSQEYALFIIDQDADKATFRRFEYYTGPILEERETTIEKARVKYAAMVASNDWMIK